jgi:hypothetical protein
MGRADPKPATKRTHPPRPSNRAKPKGPRVAYEAPEGARKSLVTDPLRQEAERGWAESARQDAKGRRRKQARARALTKRHQNTREQEADVLRLKSQLEQAERKLKNLSRGRVSAGKQTPRASRES